MNDDDFYEEGDFDEEEDGEEEDDEREFIDSEREPRTRFHFNFGKKSTVSSRRSRVSEAEESEKEEEDAYADLEDDYDPEPVEEPKKEKTASFATSPTRSTKKTSKVTPLRRTRTNQSYSSEVRVLHPLDMEQASAIGDALLDEAVVVLNLEGLDLDLAQRIIDFSSGCIYALGANLHKVTEYFFVIAPASIEITGDMKSIMRGAAPSVRAEY